MTETPEATTRTTDRDEQSDQDHLSDVEVGAGCTEIWEHLSESRASAGGD